MKMNLFKGVIVGTAMLAVGVGGLAAAANEFDLTKGDQTVTTSEDKFDSGVLSGYAEAKSLVRKHGVCDNANACVLENQVLLEEITGDAAINLGSGVSTEGYSVDSGSSKSYVAGGSHVDDDPATLDRVILNANIDVKLTKGGFLGFFTKKGTVRADVNIMFLEVQENGKTVLEQQAQQKWDVYVEDGVKISDGSTEPLNLKQVKSNYIKVDANTGKVLDEKNSVE